MKILKQIVVSALVSFVIFYAAACIIEATVNIKQMRQSTREIIFGVWLGILCIISFGIATNDDTISNQTNSQEL